MPISTGHRYTIPINIKGTSQQWSRLWLRYLMAMCVWCATPCVVAAEKIELEEVWLSAQLNQQKASDTLLFLRQKDGHLLISAKDWQQWRLRLPTTSSVRYDDENYYLMDDIQGVSYQVNEADLSIALIVDIALFESSQLSGATEEAAITLQTPLGGFINYDVASRYVDNTINSSAFLEGAVFSRLGVLENQLLIGNNNPRQLIRLDSTFTHDQLSQLTTLRLGDAVTSDINGLGGSVRFAGVQWGTNFNLQPSRVTFPLLSMQGEAVLPSTVDIFVNNAKSLSREVPIGAFTMDDLAMTAGKGEARMVITDVLGREQVVTLPYYVSPNLLQVGLQEYNYELGVVRENYGIDNQNYGHVIAVLSHRVGVTEHITHEFSAQLLQKRQMMSYGGVFLSPEWGVLHSVVAGSWDHQRGTGLALNLSLDHQALGFNWGIQATSQERHFVNITTQDQSSTLPAQALVQVFMSVPLAGYGSLSGSYRYKKAYDTEAVRMLQAGYGWNFGRWGVLTASITQDLAESHHVSSHISLSVPLGFANSNLSIQPESKQQRFSLQRSTPAGTGVGYGFIAERGLREREAASLAFQNGVGRYSLQAVQHEGQIDGDMNITGGVALLAGEAFFSRKINNSFAVVQVTNYARVRVYDNNQLMGRTNAKGSVLVPQLQPYQKNALRIEPSDLPFDAQVDALTMNVVPAFRSGLLVPFPVKSSNGATLTVLLESGAPIPAGAVVTKNGLTEAFPIGFKGELYMTGLVANNVLTVQWKNQSCQLHVTFTHIDDAVPDLGVYICKGVKP